MQDISIKCYLDDNNIIKKAKVTRTDRITKEKISFWVRIGDEFVVKPQNKLKLKHRDRRVKILRFKQNETRFYGLRANVKFLDNNRAGLVEIEDLEEFI